MNNCIILYIKIKHSEEKVGGIFLYVSLKEIAEYLHLSPDYVLQQIKIGNIKAVQDGNSYLVNKQQFVESKENIEKEILRWKEEQMEEIPEDLDVKDED